MSMVRFATLCDRCGARSEEYSAFPTCCDCLLDICPACDRPSDRTEDERNLTWCRHCAERTCAECDTIHDTPEQASACCTMQGMVDDEPNDRERGDDDGVEYADPRDYRDGLED